MKSKKNGGPIDDQNSFGYDRTTNLTPLKILIFSFFGALQCGFTYLPNQIVQLGFDSYDTRLLILAATLVSIIGVLVIGFLLDYISRKNSANIGKWLKFLLIVTLLGTSICYALLAFFPSFVDIPMTKNNQTFTCNENGANLVQNLTTYPKCMVQPNYEKLTITNCSYVCKTNEKVEEVTEFERKRRQIVNEIEKADNSPESDSDYDYDNNNNTSDENEPKPEKYSRVHYSFSPHICHDKGSFTNCYVSLNYKQKITLKNVESSFKINTEVPDQCLYPMNGFQCHIPDTFKSDNECDDAEIKCDVENTRKSLKFDFDEKPYYVLLVILGHMFPALVLILIIVTMIIATREMESQRGNISRLWIFVPIGILVFATISGVINHLTSADNSELYFIPFLTFAIVSLLCVVVVLFSRTIFNSPSNWWWHTKCQMLAVPLSSLKRYRWLIFSFGIMCFFSGIFWSVIESYRHIALIDIIENAIVGDDDPKAKTFVYIFGALISIPLIWNGEIIVDITGHVFLIALTLISFAIRFIGLCYNYSSPLNTFYEFLDPLSFYLSWFGYLLIIRHFVSKKYLCSGSAIFIAVYFLLGRGLGFYFGVSTEFKYHEQHTMFTIFAGLAVLLTIIFLAIYFCLAITSANISNDDLTKERNYPDAKSQQRVFHDERSKKGYFRY